jgi:8-oxo-dGTP pyrophosphatase MutT (NUDIX family)
VRDVVGRFDRPGRAPAEGEDVRPSAVLAMLHAPGDDQEAELILTRRAWHLRNHKGEVSFPGGGHEPHDRDLLATALRETHEEIGLDPEHVDVIGELDHLMTFSRRSYIVPFVGAVAGPLPELVPDPGEVERILHVPLSELLAPDTYRQERWDFAGQERVMHFFDLVDDTVWGATASMLYNLLGLLTRTYGGPDWHSRGV